MKTTSISLLYRVANEPNDKDWVRFLSIYRPLIRSQIRSFPALVGLEDDIAQDVVLVLIRELPHFQRQRLGAFRTWLRQIVVNQIRYAVRNNRKFFTGDELTQTVLEQADLLADPASIVAEQWDKEHDRFVFRRACELVQQEVSPIHWKAFLRYGLSGEPLDQVAEALGLSKNSVMLCKSRIAARIRKEVLGLIEE